MKATQILSATLVAIFAASALLASPAMAIPKFKLPITKRGFIAESSTSIFRVSADQITILCTRGTMAGTILDDVAVLVRAHFLGCLLEEGINGPCTIKSVGAPANGLILTELAEGLLGALHEPNGAPGILFQPHSGHVLVELESASAPCTTPATAVEGSVAGLIGATGKLSTTSKVIFAVKSATGKEEISLILVLPGIVKPKLTAYGVVEATDEHVDLASFEEAVEIV